jgi:hypothetical protein
VNEELYHLYNTRQPDFEAVMRQFRGTDLAGPLLMTTNTLYQQQKNPLLIVGQETNGWSYLHGNEVRKQMTTYKAFNVGEDYYASPFWNVTRKVEKAVGGVPYSCAWTNISKFDVEGGRSYGEQERIIATVDDVLVGEINILKPTVCLFFSGPHFDTRLKHIFPGITYEAVPNWSERQLARLVHPGLPTHTFRTYHPNYLRRSGREAAFVEFVKSLPL